MLLPIFILFNGCTSLYEIDLAEEREMNLSNDLESLCFESAPVLPDPLTLDDAVRVGLENNLDMRISRIMAEITDDNVRAQKLKMLPSLGLNGGLSQSSTESDPDEDTLSKSASLSLTWNILDFGLSYIRSRQTAFQEETRRMGRLRQAQLLAAEISTSYWQAVLALDSLEAVRQIETQLSAYKTKADALVAERRLDPITSKSIEKKIVDLAITVASLRSEISSAKISLCELMGLEPSTEFRVERASFHEYMGRLPVPEQLDSRKLEMISLNNRPELFSADINMRVQEDEVRAALVSMFPGLSFSYAGSYNANSSYASNFWTTWGATVASSLLALPSQYVQWEAQKKTAVKTETERLLLTAGIMVQAHMALHDYRVRTEQLELHEKSFRITEELLDMTRERHALGLVTGWGLTQKMLDEVVSRLGRDRRVIGLVNAYNKLMVTLGLDYERWGDNILEMDENALPEYIESRDVPADAAEPDEDFFSEEISIPEEYNDIGVQNEMEHILSPDEMENNGTEEGWGQTPDVPSPGESEEGKDENTDLPSDDSDETGYLMFDTGCLII